VVCDCSVSKGRQRDEGQLGVHEERGPQAGREKGSRGTGPRLAAGMSFAVVSILISSARTACPSG
jgi:hypothetical protein